MTDESLSDKIYGDKPGYILQAQLPVKDVKEFVSEIICSWSGLRIKKRAGPKLI